MMSLQRTAFVVGIAVLALLASPVIQVFSTRDYESLTAQEKFHIVWHRVISDSTSASFPSTLAWSWLFVQDPKVTVDHVSDEMPDGRRKLLYSVGAVAGIKFIPTTDTPYDGIFEGAEHGIVRCSLPYIHEKGIIPACALKFFRDGVPSANILIQRSYVPQLQFYSNFFKFPFSNHLNWEFLPDQGTEMLLNKFEKSVSDWPNFVGLSDVARYRQNGEQVKDFNFPFQLHFKPTTELSSADDFSGYFTEQLTSIGANTTLWTVYARDRYEDRAFVIGKIVTTRPFHTSKYGDEKLFFQHQIFEDDLELRDDMLGERNVVLPDGLKFTEHCLTQGRHCDQFWQEYYPNPRSTARERDFEQPEWFRLD